MRFSSLLTFVAASLRMVLGRVPAPEPAEEPRVPGGTSTGGVDGPGGERRGATGGVAPGGETSSLPRRVPRAGVAAAADDLNRSNSRVTPPAHSLPTVEGPFPGVPSSTGKIYYAFTVGRAGGINAVVNGQDAALSLLPRQSWRRRAGDGGLNPPGYPDLESALNFVYNSLPPSDHLQRVPVIV